MRNLLLCSLFLVGITFSACHKNKITKIPVNAALKAAFNYLPGTYWVYRDSISGRIDSFFVTSEQDAYYNVPNGNDPSNTSVEYINILISDYNISPSSAVDSQHWKLSYSGMIVGLTYNLNISPLIMNYDPLIEYPFNNTVNSNTVNSNSPGVNVDSLTLINIYRSFMLNGQAYINVAEVNHHEGYAFSSDVQYNDWFYICPSVGIIKMSLNHPEDSINRVWEIQRWNIVKT